MTFSDCETALLRQHMRNDCLPCMTMYCGNAGQIKIETPGTSRSFRISASIEPITGLPGVMGDCQDESVVFLNEVGHAIGETGKKATTNAE